LLPRTWKVPQLIFKNWNDGVVVFNVRSGNTHLLNPVTVQILKILTEQPRDVAQIAERLATENDTSVDDELLAELEKALLQLDELGLIEPASQ